ncbi:MAG: damage-inducible protein DinB [Acidobacteria bacterium]|jgi:uncharacterized damage-inducible protein DinB|nr:damage-inducible protein DinB [Acidobacteriota bacterium]
MSSELLTAVLTGWDRHNEVLVNLLRALPAHALGARVMDGSPTVASMFSHIHHERLCSVLENVPELGSPKAAGEWRDDRDVEHLASQLNSSAAFVRDAVARRVDEGRALDQDFAHPLHLIQFLIFHEGYHHGQIKLALKVSGSPMSDDVAGPVTWQRWRERS